MNSGCCKNNFFAFVSISLFCLISTQAEAQDFERYRPRTIPNQQSPTQVSKEPLSTVEGSDRALVESLDSVIVVDQTDKIDPNNSFENSTGINFDFDSADSLVFSDEFFQIVNRYLGKPITLRKLNRMSRDLILFYRESGQPVVDVIIPEQKITAGTVQIVVLESRVGQVFVEGGCFFEPCDLERWIYCTQSGDRIYESSIAQDLFRLNQNPFRRVDVDLRPGKLEGTTDVVFESTDVRPLNAYVGYEDTGVRALKLERLYGGVIWGNAFGRDATLSYQYTADVDLRHLHAHAASYLEPLNHCWSFQTYGSWAGVAPKLGAGLTQGGESWQAGVGLVRHLTKNQNEDTRFSFGFDFKSTNNNLEFGGVSVAASSAELAQLRFGIQSLLRCECDEYSLLSVDFFVGPGERFSPNATDAAFNTIRPGTSADYIYTRGRYEELKNLPCGWQLTLKAKGQLSSERLLFSETIGLGGYDSIRGYDQRVNSGDRGWIANVELGPAPFEWCQGNQLQTLRLYTLFDAGGIYLDDPLPGEVEQEVLTSAGVGLRWSLGDRTNLRVEYAHGFEDAAFGVTEDRLHIGFVRLLGPRP